MDLSAFHWLDRADLNIRLRQVSMLIGAGGVMVIVVAAVVAPSLSCMGA